MDFGGMIHMVISWMSGEGNQCMHTEHLESSAHASWKVFLDTLAVIVGQSLTKPTILTVLRFSDDY
jgi:hypothetical protein